MSKKLITYIQHASLLIFFILFTSCTQESNEKRPNILMIFTDDLTYRAIGYNNPEVHTPNLDKLVSEGIIFQNHYVATPICAASRASMMTGRFPQQNGTVALDSESFINKVGKDKSYPSLPRLFNQGGYETWFAGKSHLGPAEEYGFQKAKITDDPRDSTLFSQANR